MPDFLNNIKDKAIDIWQRAPTVVVVCGVGLLLLCSTCCLCGGCMGTFFDSGESDRGGPASGAGAASDGSASQVSDGADAE